MASMADYEFVDSDYSIASTAEQFADGTVLAALNASRYQPQELAAGRRNIRCLLRKRCLLD